MAETIDTLIESIKESDVIVSEDIERALKENPRELFVPHSLRQFAYIDSALPTFNGQTISQPSTVVRMTELLNVKQGQKVLEIGTGSGWQSAILATLVGKNGNVFTIEKDQSLVDFSKENLRKVGKSNVHVTQGDGSLGFKDASPYDRIIVTAASPQIPPALIAQLKTDGKMVLPVGTKDVQELLVVEKDDEGEVSVFSTGFYIFVPLVGEQGFPKSLSDQPAEKGEI